jgi:hypothetical protein
MSADMGPVDIDLSKVSQLGERLLTELNQLSEFFSALVQRFDGVDILDNELHFMSQFVFRGLHGLNVRFHPRG